MADIIRPTFGTPSKIATNGHQWIPIEAIGNSAGYVIGLIRERSAQGSLLRVVVGRTAGNTIETVALYPDAMDEEIVARGCAAAILGALEIIERGRQSS